MGPSTSDGEGYIDRRPWSPPGRPTVITSFREPSLSTPSDDLSQHLSSVPPSPWSPNVPSPSHPTSYMLPQTASRPSTDGLSQHQPLSDSEWSNLFSAPLNPSVFAALAANGVLGDSSSHTPLQSSHFNSSPRSQVNQQGFGHGQTASWSHSSTPYLPSNSSYIHKPSMTRHSHGNAVPRDKDISSTHYSPIQPRPHAAQLPKGRDDRYMSGSNIGSRRQSTQEPGGLSNAAFSRPTDSRINHRTSGPFVAPLNSPGDYHPGYSFPGERSNIGLPPSLWMSPTSTPSTPASYGTLHPPSLSAISTGKPADSSVTSSYGQSPNHSATESKSAMFSDMFSDDLFDLHSLSVSEHGASSFTSPRLSGSPDLKAAELAAANADPETLAREDPLATQVWKMYARTKATLPHAQRMENLTWRMMALALKKKKEDEELKSPIEGIERRNSLIRPKEEPNPLMELPQQGSRQDNERGRGRDKVRVVGFDGTNQDGQDGPEADEYVLAHSCVLWHYY
jgi:GATA-binding protein, other eukaryote